MAYSSRMADAPISREARNFVICVCAFGIVIHGAFEWQWRARRARSSREYSSGGNIFGQSLNMIRKAICSDRSSPVTWASRNF